MQGKMSRVVVGSATVFLALLLAWRIGLWLEPRPTDPALAAVPSTPREPPFAVGKTPGGTAYELRGVRVSPDGQVQGVGILGYAVRREELKPAAAAMLRTLRERFPAAASFFLVLKPAESCPGCDIGQVSAKGGEIVLRYGIPSAQQIESSNALIGSREAGDRPRLYLPDGETFAAGLAIVTALQREREKDPSLTEEQALERAAASAGMQYPVAKRGAAFMQWYYTGNRYGSEEFTLE
ncbi:MAG TPA: hypothetical protein VNX25_09310 [Verrucomicrobiae bacterium]|nr:hypothetical protein [Verrucomicrobiae bacterium]